jgi:hypothetical protein
MVALFDDHGYIERWWMAQRHGDWPVSLCGDEPADVAALAAAGRTGKADGTIMVAIPGWMSCDMFRGYESGLGAAIG